MMILSTPGHLFLVVLFLWENAQTDVDVCQTVFPFFMGAKSTNYRCALYVFRSDCLFKPGVGFL